ncbi:MAG: DNA polymerase IV [Patescibacteria group bacterium]|nr:DNA polymerase IV [Patescibacteria group bacterium]
MNRIILHIDMDYFFAQVEERENPQFRGKPVVVGADPKGGKGRGVVSTANYEARKYGIHSALPISKAYQLCPKAIFLPVNMELYQKASENIMEIIKKYSKIFEQVSLDEAYLDLSYNFYGRRNCTMRISWEKAENLAQKLKKEIFEKEKLTSTIGIGPNKLIAKMAAEKAKPNGLLIIKPNQVRKFLEPLDIEDLPGIGPKTAEKLRAIKINKIKELKTLSESKLKSLFGITGETIYQKARGIDEEPVSPEKVIKSIGKEHTFEKDTRDPEIIFNTFEKIIEDVHQELIENKFSFKTITVICRFRGFETHTKSKTLKEPTNDLKILKKEAKNLLLKFLIENLKLIRLIGLRVKIC